MLIEQDEVGLSRARSTLAGLFEATRRTGSITEDEAPARLETSIAYVAGERCGLVIKTELGGLWKA